VRRLVALVFLQLWLGAAQACLFVKDIAPGQWYHWASALFAGEVTGVAQESGRVDVITVRVTETFKGPQGEAATLRVPSRMWSSCRMELPAPGARVLVALNANHDTALVPLRPDYADALRQHRTSGGPGGPNGALDKGH
jgi:hypothetical protein